MPSPRDFLARVKASPSFLLGLAGVACALTTIFLNNRYFFLRDDGLVQNLPMEKLQFQSLMGSHQFAQINWYQFLGQPILGQGHTGVFYPLNYLGFAVAKLLGSPDYFPSVLQSFHVVLAYCGMYLLVRESVRASKPVAALVAFSYALNGFLLDVGRVWPNFPAYVALSPWLYWIVFRSRHDSSAQLWAVPLRLLILANGHLQMAFYTFLFEWLWFLLSVPSKKQFFDQTVSTAASLLLAAPILLPIFNAAGLSARNGAGFQDQFMWAAVLSHYALTWLHPLLPFREGNAGVQGFFALYWSFLIPLCEFLGLYALVAGRRRAVQKYRALTQEQRTLALLCVLAFLRIVYLRYHLSSLPDTQFAGVLLDTQPAFAVLDLLVVAFACFSFLRRLSLRSRVACAAASLGFLALSLGLGEPSFYANATLPLMHVFRFPHKYVLYVQLFLAVALAKPFSRVRLHWAATALLLGAGCFYVYNVAIFHNQEYAFGSALNRPHTYPIGPVLDAVPPSVRFLGSGDTYGGTAVNATLQANLATYYGRMSFGGYEALQSSKRLALDPYNLYPPLFPDSALLTSTLPTMRAYSVSKYLFVADFNLPVDFIRAAGLVPGYSDSATLVYTDPLAQPFAAAEGKALNFALTGNQARVLVPNRASPVTVTIAVFGEDLRDWQAEMGGVRYPVGTDSYGRLTVALAPGAEGELSVGFFDHGFRLGLWIASATVLGGLLYFTAKGYRTRIRKKAAAQASFS